MSNIKNTWKGINLQNRKTRGDSSITALKRPGNGGLSQNNKKKIMLMSYLIIIMTPLFSSIGPNLAARIPA